MVRPIDEPYNRREPPSEIPVFGNCKNPREIHFLTFSGGAEEYRQQVNRIHAEAKSLGCFNTIHALSDDSSHPWVRELIETHGTFIRNHRRGYGLWLWKPFLVSKALKALQEGDVLVYMDSGCEISKQGKRIFEEYLNCASANDALLWEIPFLEREWTSKYVADALAVPNEHLDSRQIQATWFMLVRNARTIELVNRWLSLSLYKDGEYLIGLPEVSGTTPASFIPNHRQDQSLFSILCKEYDMVAFPWQDRFVPWLYVRGSWVLHFPIHARRCRGKGVVYELSEAKTTFSGVMSKCEPKIRIFSFRGFYVAFAIARKFVQWLRN